MRNMLTELDTEVKMWLIDLEIRDKMAAINILREIGEIECLQDKGASEVYNKPVLQNRSNIPPPGVAHDYIAMAREQEMAREVVKSTGSRSRSAENYAENPWKDVHFPEAGVSFGSN